MSGPPPRRTVSGRIQHGEPNSSSGNEAEEGSSEAQAVNQTSQQVQPTSPNEASASTVKPSKKKPAFDIRVSKRPQLAVAALSSTAGDDPATSSFTAAASSSSVPATSTRRGRSSNSDDFYYRSMRVVVVDPKSNLVSLRIRVETSDGLSTSQHFIAHPTGQKTAVEVLASYKCPIRSKQGKSAPGGLALLMEQHINATLQHGKTQFLDLKENQQIQLLQEVLDDQKLPLKIPKVVPSPTVWARVLATNGAAAFLASELRAFLPPLPDNLPDAHIAEKMGKIDARIPRVSICASGREEHGKVPATSTSLAARPRMQTASGSSSSSRQAGSSSHAATAASGSSSSRQAGSSSHATSTVSSSSSSGEDIKLIIPESTDIRDDRWTKSSDFGLQADRPEAAKKAAAELRTLLNNSYAMSVQREVLYRKSVLKQSDTEILAWLAEEVEDFGLPSVVPNIPSSKRPELTIPGFDASITLFPTSKDDAIELARLAFDLILKAQRVLGDVNLKKPAFALALKQDLELAMVRMQLQRTNLDEIGLPIGIFSVRQLHSETDSYLIEQGAGSNKYRCFATPALHDTQRIFTESEVWFKSCVVHAAHNEIAIRPLKHIGQLLREEDMARSIKASDQRRNVTTPLASARELLADAKSLPKTLYAGQFYDKWPLAEIKAILCSQTLDRAAQLRQLKVLLPGLPVSAFDSAALPTSVIPPLHVPVVAYLDGQSWSVDQLRQVNDDEGGDGSVLGHSKETCGLLPRCLQLPKQSRPLSDLTIWHAAVSVQATPLPKAEKARILGRLSTILSSQQPVRKALCNARYGSVKLDPAYFALSREITGLALEGFDPASSLSASREALEEEKRREPQSDIVAHAKSYKLQAAQMDEETWLKGQLSAEQAQMRAKNVKTMKKALTAKELESFIKQVKSFTDKLDSKVGPDGKKSSRNGDKLPELWWPGSSTAELLDMLTQIIIKALVFCDMIVVVRCGIILEWPDKLSCIVVVFCAWVEYWYAFQNSDRFSGLRLEGFDGGDMWHPSKVALMVHVCHLLLYGQGQKGLELNVNAEADDEDHSTLPLGRRVNISVSSILTNNMFMSKSPTVIRCEIEASRPVADATLRILKAGKMLEISDEVLNQIRDRPETLSQDQLATIAKNGMTWLERMGKRVYEQGDFVGDDDD